MTALAVTILLLAAFVFCAEAVPLWLRRAAWEPMLGTLPPPLARLWALAANAALGFGIGGTALLALGAGGGYHRWLLVGLGVGCALGCIALHTSRWRIRSGTVTDASKPPVSFSVLPYMAAILAAVVVLWWVTNNPEIEVDGATYHLSVPKAWLLEGGIGFQPWSVMSNWPFLSEMGNLWGFAFAPENTIVAKLLELSRSLLMVCACAGLGAWLYGARAGWLAAALAVCWRELSRYGTSDHTDVGRSLFIVTGVGTLGLYAVDPRRRASLALGASLLGFAVAVKYTTLPTPFAALVGALLIRIYKHGSSGLAMDIPIAVGCFALPVIPWLVKNGVYTGNPFYPFLTGLFETRREAAIPLDYARGYFGDGPPWGALYNLSGHLYVIRSNVRLEGVYGVLILAPLGFLFRLLNRHNDELSVSETARTHLALTLLIALPFFILMPIPRFMMELYPLSLIFCIGEGIRCLERRASVRTLNLVAIALVALFLARFLSFNFRDNYGRRALVVEPQLPTLTEASIRSFYDRHAPEVAIWDYTNDILGPNDRVAVSSRSMCVPLLRVRFLPVVPTMSPDIVTMILAATATPDEAAEEFRRIGVSHLLTTNGLEEPSEAVFREEHLELLQAGHGHFLYQIR